MRRVLLLVVAMSFVASASYAGVNLTNEDAKTYDIKVYEGSTTKHTNIASGVTFNGQCANACKIEIVGGSTIEAQNGKTVVIKNGAMSLR